VSRPPERLGAAEQAFVWASPAMARLDEMARRIADSDLTVLIHGESGVGKEVIARHVHACSTRRDRPFVKVNCAAVPETLLESELFGYEKAAFTGADARRSGKFEAARGGTVMLDEITEMTARLQAKLLHVLQDKSFSRLGGNEVVAADVRVVAATNRGLEDEVDAGRFREDLYFRLKVIDLHVPPLRERREEIPLLVDHFVKRFAQQYRREVPPLSERLMSLLVQHRWTGNIRELENAIKRLVVLGDEVAVMTELLSSGVDERTRDAPAPPARDAEPEPILSLKEVGRRAAQAAERQHILMTLERTRWNRVKAARLLQVSYKTLLTKMKQCGLSDA